MGLSQKNAIFEKNFFCFFAYILIYHDSHEQKQKKKVFLVYKYVYIF